MLQVCSTSTDEQLTTTGAVLLEMYGTTSSTGELARLDKLISRASRWAESYIGQPLTVQTYLETVPAYGGRNLMLSRTPVRSVSRVFDSTATCEATEYSSTEIRIEDPDAGLISFVDDSFPGWTAVQGFDVADYVQPNSELRPWLVEYEAGYLMPGTTSTAIRTLPEDLEMGVIEKVKQFHGGMSGVTAKRVGDLSINFRSEGPDAAEALLGPYRRII